MSYQHDLPPCVGIEPLLFDATDIATHLQVRPICGDCSFVVACFERATEIAHEHSRYNKGARGPDGTWAGLLWRDGHVIAVPDEVGSKRRRRTAVCGTDGGYARHLRTLREPPCGDCRKAHRDYERDRVARRASA